MIMMVVQVVDGRGNLTKLPLLCTYFYLLICLLIVLTFDSEDGKLGCGYSSFRGSMCSRVFKRESFQESHESFRIFDKHQISHKSVPYYFCFLYKKRKKNRIWWKLNANSDFLESGKVTFCDDGLTASTTILVGNHLYVANVGDSRTVISKSENGNYLF